MNLSAIIIGVMMVPITNKRVREIKHNYDLGFQVFPRETKEEKRAIIRYWKELPKHCNLKQALQKLEKELIYEP